ncbi:S8 family serine peptidase [Streptomyces sp. NPDC056257]|uniref:S8 family peptidase n=1 Tax=Streptomyces sp. NPDC056257 TaxID=3345765 RepID=UPI0035D81EB4
MALCVAQAALMAAPFQAVAAPEPGPGPGTPSLSGSATAGGQGGPRSQTVTLITGDKAISTVAEDGTLSHSLRDPAGKLTAYEMNRSGQGTYIYPRSALPYVAAGQLDRELFNVTRLLADGYDDARQEQLPVIVTYTDAAARSRAQSAPDGARKIRSLASIEGSALSADRSKTFWSSITGSETSSEAQGRSRAPGAKPSLTGGIAKVWLDGKVKAALADSTVQVGAPQVWASGNTAKGVNVAVLDTGVDTEHPDLVNSIASSQAFVPDREVMDFNGHGTHVASTIVGTGAASDGKEKGVAPGAKLLVGKVLDDNGSGQESWVLAGMEWAARDQHAKIVNMSLGGSPSDGTDLLSQAVNRLSDETGALFTVAAGNAGSAWFTVGAPGAAESALTVGAVDKSDALADFSSRGPRTGDGGIKPDLTAPGVDILAARSQHVPRSTGYYRPLSGTSMATPHVAGAAALLSAEHPDWTGRQLKEALVSTTKATPQYSPFAGGSGRLDIAATTKATLLATGSVAFGRHAWPTEPGLTVDREITYTNTGDSPVTLDLSGPGDKIPAGVFTLSTPRVTVPAHGNASVTATAHIDRAPDNQSLAGLISATDPSGTVRAHTMIGTQKEGEHHRLTLKATDRSGKPLGGVVTVRSKDRVDFVPIGESGAADVRIPAGSYSLWLSTELEGANGPRSLGLAILPVPEVKLDQDRTVVFDGTRARQIRAVTPQASEPSESRIQAVRTYSSLNSQSSTMWQTKAYDSIWTLPTTAEVTEGEFLFGTRWRLEQPALTVTTPTRTLGGLLVERGSTALPKGHHRLEAVFAREGTEASDASVKAKGKAVIVRAGDAATIEKHAAAAAAAGAKALLVVPTGDGRLTPWETSPWLPKPAPLTVASLSHQQGEELIGLALKGRAELDVTSHPTTEYLYDLVHDYRGAIPTNVTYKPTSRELAQVKVSFRNFQADQALERRADETPDGSTTLNDGPAPAQGERVDWVTAGEQWTQSAEIPMEQQQYGSPETYRAGQVAEEHWFGPVMRPRLRNGAAPVRQNDSLFIGVPAWGDSGNSHVGGTYGNVGVENLMKLYQGTTLLRETNRRAYSMTVEGLSADPLPYRLVSENARDAWGGSYSTSTRTEWGFTSRGTAAGQPAQMPLIQLDYAVETDVAGRAKRRADLTIAASHLSASAGTAAIGVPALEVSYDDGITWRRAPLKHTDKGWRTSLDAPRAAQYVTLRATARDAQGNHVVQNITRAFGLK